MLSKLFTSAKNLLIATAQPESTKSSGSTSASVDEDMVTTRKQSGKDASENSIVAETVNSSRKRQKRKMEQDVQEIAEVEGLGSAGKRKNVLPVRAKDEEVPRTNTRVVVEIPVSSARAYSNPNLAVDSIEKDAPKEPVVIEISDSELEEANSEDDESEAEGEDTAPGEPKSQPSSTEKNRNEGSATQPAWASPIPTTKSQEGTTSAAKPKHKKFGSEEPEVEFFSTAAERLESEESSEEDEAPEVVGAQDALESARAQTRDAARAAEEQEAASRKKRKERDATLKQQAEAAGKKRKRSGNIEEAAIDVTASASKRTKFDDSTPTDQPPKLSLTNLPALLPEEYLVDDAEQETATTETDLTPAAQRSKKFRYPDLADKPPKDRRKGSTIYRVSQTQSVRLPPKASFQARSVKETWLQGRAGKSLGNKRKPFSTGFFKKRD